MTLAAGGFLGIPSEALPCGSTPGRGVPDMRTLVVTTTFPQWEDDPRGVFVRRHWEQRCTTSTQVRVLVPRTRWSEGALEGPLEVERFAYAPKRWSALTGNFGILENLRSQPWLAPLVPMFWWANWRALERTLEQARWDQVIAHMLLPAGWIVAAQCARREIPFEVYCHGTDVDLFLRLPPLLRRRGWRWLRHAGAIYFPSAQKRNRFVERMGSCVRGVPLRVETMTHCVAQPPAADVAMRRPEILFLGRLTRQKGVADLLHAVSQIVPRPRVHVAGDGPERRRLEQLASRLGLEVEFHGFVWGERKETLFAQTAVLCVPSRELRGGWSEGTPLVIAEAVCRGLPVVATGVGGIPELNYGTQLRVVPPGRREALVGALLKALGDARKPGSKPASAWPTYRMARAEGQ